MNINITARKFRAKDTLTDHINKKIRTLEKYNSNIIDVDVIMSFTHLKDSIKKIEITVNIPGKVLAVSDESDDFRKSTDNAVDKLTRQLKKVKSKVLAKPKVQ
ncbi:MAG: ribosome-associated translation inhibitor RaiA [Bacteroidetes bacterium]|nr:ribosome-associated translation inhibitor RaiA [Bacteroidota bacterium]